MLFPCLRPLGTACLCLLGSLLPAAAAPGVRSALTAPPRLLLDFPTENRALVEGRPQDFFMGVDRNFEGQTTFVWEGGQYGFVRNPLRNGGELVYTRFHEGVDIAPLQRDARGEPLDLVHSISDGIVVFCSISAGASNYGNYVVVQHEWGWGPFYSLYGHLNHIDTQVGATVARGALIGHLGHTGSGIDRRRSHVHLELNVLLSEKFDAWHLRNEGKPSATIYNGLNMSGLNIAGLYTALNKDPGVTVPGYLATVEPYFKVTVPRREPFDLLRRYPWLLPLATSAKTPVTCPSWEISFTASGFPLTVMPSDLVVQYPVATWVQFFAGKHSWKTMGRLGGSGETATLLAKGTEYVNLLVGNF